MTAKISNMLEQLSEEEQVIIFEVVKRFLPDDMATPDDLEAIAKAREEYARGECVRLEDLDL